VFVEWEGAAVPRAQVLQKFDSRTGGCTQRGDAEMSSEDVIEVFLFRSKILAFPRHPQAQQSTIKLQATVGVGNGDGRVIDTEKKSIIRTMPFGIAFSFGKPQDFQGVFVGVFEVEGFDAAGVLVPIWQTLRPGRREFHLVLP